MEYTSIFLIIIATLPITLPLVYWFVLKRRESAVYVYCLVFRRIYAVAFSVSLIRRIYKIYGGLIVEPPYEAVGGTIGGFIIVYLLWRKWKKDVGENGVINNEAEGN
jgi:hypothetical protein